MLLLPFFRANRLTILWLTHFASLIIIYIGLISLALRVMASSNDYFQHMIFFFFAESLEWLFRILPPDQTFGVNITGNFRALYKSLDETRKTIKHTIEK